LELHKEFGVYIPLDMEVTQGGKKGTYFLKNEPILIKGHNRILQLECSQNLGVVYQKRPEELFDTESLGLKILSSGPFRIRLKTLSLT